MYLFHDKPPSPDLQDLLNAVALLDISEFHLFELAYRDWFGRSAQTRYLEHVFDRYLYGEEIPFWVRNYAREILRQRDNPDDDRFPHEPLQHSATIPAIRRGLKILLGLIFILVFLIVLTSNSPQWMLFGGECYFPPCY